MSDSTTTAIGIDIGGTKIAVAAVDESGNVSDLRQFASQGESAESIWAQLQVHLHELAKPLRRPRIGIGSAGPIDPSAGWISPVNIPSLRRFPIVDEIRNLDIAEVVNLHGDAIAFTHAEHRFGAGRGVNDLLGVVVSTGIGGGVVLNGRLLPGRTGNAGYIGHTVIVKDGDSCPCGRRGCIELFSSGPNMVNQALRQGWQSPANGSFHDLAESARQGDVTALAVIDDGARALAIGLVNQFAMLDISTAVIGGGVSFSGAVFWDPLLRHVGSEASRVGFIGETSILPAALGAHAGVIGAALAALDPA
jgi:glucokinase